MSMRHMSRDFRLDFLRGIALLVVLIDHIEAQTPIALIRAWTPRTICFFDGADAFVFLSGLVFGRVFRTKLVQDGFLACQTKAIRRALRIYATYLLTAWIAIGLGIYFRDFSPNLASLLTLETGITNCVYRSVSMSYQPYGLEILALYATVFPFLPKAFCGACVAASLLGSLSTFPHSMSYFNLAAGGPLGGPKHLLDANADWGQDLLELKRFVDCHPEVVPIQLAYFGCADPNIAGFPHESILQNEKNELAPAFKPGWYAISVNHVFGYRHYDYDKPTFTRFQSLTPDAMAGYSIYIYHVTEDASAILNSAH